MKIYSTLSRKLEEFEPLEPGRARLYTCGPTVYNYAHIGNFRAYIFEDILRRQLKAEGYDVTQVMNITDIDDKTIRGASGAGVALRDYTERYTSAFFEDLEALNIEPAEHYPAATDHVSEMQELIGKLFDNGYAYQSDEGSVYFDLGKFKSYGKLARLDMSGLRAGARVAQDEYDKENVADFALWKAWDEADGDVVWDSPWGRGRPGWHIECSAMSMKYLGETFDIHTGGIDNMFPHHENEIAQSEGATGKPFVKYWMHCGYLVVDGTKMSKSLGNFYTLRDILEKGYAGREVRYVLLSAHYRQPLNFTFGALDAARAALSRLDDFKSRLNEQAGADAESGAEADAPDWAARGRRDFKAAMNDDLNMPEALGAIFEMVHAGNKAMDGQDLASKQAAAALEVMSGIDLVLGVLQTEDAAAPDSQVLDLAEQRSRARADKNWGEADRLRDELAQVGWEVRDTPDGPKLKRIRS